MKNIFKVFGIIAIVAVIGFSITACEEEKEAGDAYLTIVNQFDGTVTKVVISVVEVLGNKGDPLTFDNLNITKGNSQTFTIPDTVFDTSVPVNSRSNTIGVHFSGTYPSRVRFVAFQSGKTKTIIVSASGDLVE